MYVIDCIAAAGERREEKNQIGYDKYAAETLNFFYVLFLSSLPHGCLVGAGAG